MTDRFNCELCHFTTNKKSSFDNHLQSLKHQKAQMIRDVGDDIEIVIERKRRSDYNPDEVLFQCPYCHRDFLKKYNLNRHLSAQRCFQHIKLKKMN